MHWKEKPDWWDSFLEILQDRVERRGRLILTKALLKAYLIKVGAIDFRDRGYKNIIQMTREALLNEASWTDGLKVVKLSRTTLKVMRNANNDD